MGCRILLKYLTDTSASLLQQKFVHIDEPFANNVGFSLMEFSAPSLYLEFTNVPISKISEISAHLQGAFNRIFESKTGIDMQRMNTVIQRYLLEGLSNLESGPHDLVFDVIVQDFLYGNDEVDVIYTNIISS